MTVKKLHSSGLCVCGKVGHQWPKFFGQQMSGLKRKKGLGKIHKNLLSSIRENNNKKKNQKDTQSPFLVIIISLFYWLNPTRYCCRVYRYKFLLIWWGGAGVAAGIPLGKQNWACCTLLEVFKVQMWWFTHRQSCEVQKQAWSAVVWQMSFLVNPYGLKFKNGERKQLQSTA
jgi:hypothetical protein